MKHARLHYSEVKRKAADVQKYWIREVHFYECEMQGVCKYEEKRRELFNPDS